MNMLYCLYIQYIYSLKFFTLHSEVPFFIIFLIQNITYLSSKTAVLMVLIHCNNEYYTNLFRDTFFRITPGICNISLTWDRFWRYIYILVILKILYQTLYFQESELVIRQIVSFIYFSTIFRTCIIFPCRGVQSPRTCPLIHPW